MSINYREYKNGDKNKIIDLFRVSFDRDIDENEWCWRYLNNPLPKRMITLAESDDGVIAGHYALSPREIYYNGTKLGSGLSMTTMTHPDYRGLGIFRELALKNFKDNYDNLEIIYGVPNEFSLKGFTKYLNFQHISDIPFYEGHNIEFNGTISNNIKEVDEFSIDYNILEEKIKNKYKIILSRDSKYLNWRYFENPENDYRVFEYSKDIISGYVVTKVFVDENGNTSIDIVDIIAMDKNIFEELVKYVVNVYGEVSNRFNLWINDLDFINCVEQLGFRKTEKELHFIARDNKGELSEVFEYKNWYLTMGDIDIF